MTKITPTNESPNAVEVPVEKNRISMKNWTDKDEELAQKEEAFTINYYEKHGRYPSDEVERDY